MIKRLTQQSALLTLWFNSSTKLYEAHSVNVFVSFLIHIKERILHLSVHPFLAHSLLLRQLPWKSIFISLFLLSLVLGGGDAIQFSELPTSQLIPGKISSRIFSFNVVSLKTAALVLLILYFIFELRRNRLRRRFLRLEVLMILFFVTSAISAVFSFSLPASFAWLLKLAAGFMIYMIFSRIPLRYRDILFISLTFLAILLFEETFAIAQFLRGGLLGTPFENIGALNLQEFPYSAGGISYLRVIGTLGHPKVLSFYIMLLLPLTIILSYIKKATIRRIAMLCMLLGILTVILTISRWELIVSVVGILLTIFLIKKILHISVLRVTTNKVLLITLLFFVIFLLTSPFTFERFFQFDLSKGTFQTRAQLVSQALFMLQSQPLIGIGGDAFQPYFVNYDVTDDRLSGEFLRPVHSLYLLLLSELGFISTLLFIAIAVDVIFLFIRKVKSLSSEKKLFTIGFFTSTIVILLHGIFEVQPFTATPGILFWLVLALCINLLMNKTSIKAKATWRI